MRVLLSLLLLSFCACATLDEKQCAAGRWREIGRVDGFFGRTSEFLQNHQHACAGVTVDREAYEQGRREGLKEYCTPERAYAVGENGSAYLGVCPAESEARFKESYAKGRDVFSDRAYRREIEEKISAENKRRSEEQSALGSVLTAIGDLSGTSERAQLVRSRESVDQRIAKSEAEAPVGLKTSLYEGHDRDQAQAFVGALAGTVIGFGSGHAIQGRYLESGWKFSSLEVASIGAMMAGGSDSSGPIAFGGFMAFVGLKIWEAIDLFRHSQRIAAGYPLAGDGAGRFKIGARLDQPSVLVSYDF